MLYALLPITLNVSAFTLSAWSTSPRRVFRYTIHKIFEELCFFITKKLVAFGNNQTMFQTPLDVVGTYHYQSSWGKDISNRFSSSGILWHNLAFR